jgi:hypothetical protein
VENASLKIYSKKFAMNNNVLPIILSTPNNSPSFSFISTIQPTDKKLLELTVKYFKPSSQNYEDSWGYIIQATRYGGFKWYDPNNGSLVFFGRKSQTNPTLIVVNYFADPTYLAKVIKTMKKVTRAPQVILKNINTEDVPTLLEFNFQEYQPHDFWADDARFDDQTYPQLVSDLESVVKMKGKIYHQLRKALRKDAHATIRKYKNTDKEAVTEIFKLKDLHSNSNNAYYASHIMYPDASLNKFTITDSRTNKIIGFTATSDITITTTALVSLIFMPGVKTASIWGIYQTLLLNYAKGIKYVNFGGCEYEGSYIFRTRTFRPVKKIQKTHLLYK